MQLRDFEQQVFTLLLSVPKEQLSFFKVTRIWNTDYEEYQRENKPPLPQVIYHTYIYTTWVLNSFKFNY